MTTKTERIAEVRVQMEAALSGATNLTDAQRKTVMARNELVLAAIDQHCADEVEPTDNLGRFMLSYASKVDRAAWAAC